jgi:hypothetical protein
MTTRIMRVSLPVLLCAAGFAMVAYGVFVHAVPVVQDREVEKSISELQMDQPEEPGGPPQDPFGSPQDPFGSPQDPFGSPQDPQPPQSDPWGPPSGPPLPKTVVVLERETVDDSEPAIILDVTRDGLALLDTGEIKRLYTPGMAPALCPT